MPTNEWEIGVPVKSWREQAVARSLDTARARAESRVQRFLDAALDLLHDNATGKEFTVQEVVERSEQSLRSFYQYFGGKQDLLMALFEESVRSTADLLREKVAEESDPLDRLHCFVIEYYRLCRTSGPKTSKSAPARALGEFAQQLLTSQPADAAQAFVPLVSLFEEILDEAAEAGKLRAGIPHDGIVGVVLEAIMFHAFSITISGSSAPSTEGDPAEQLWDLIFYGIRGDAAEVAGPATRAS